MNTIVDNENQGQHALYCSTKPILQTHIRTIFLFALIFYTKALS